MFSKLFLPQECVFGGGGLCLPKAVKIPGSELERGGVVYLCVGFSSKAPGLFPSFRGVLHRPPATDTYSRFAKVEFHTVAQSPYQNLLENQVPPGPTVSVWFPSARRRRLRRFSNKISSSVQTGCLLFWFETTVLWCQWHCTGTAPEKWGLD